MGREIKFRGMTVNGEWHYGLLANPKSTRTLSSVIEKDGWYISNSVGMPFAYQIRPETIGEFTGLRDKNGVEIFEGDILHACVMNGSIVNAQVIFNGGCYLVSALQGENWAEDLFQHCRNEVIGNIYENAELLEAVK